MDRHSAAFHADHLTFRGAFRVSQAKLPDSIHYTRFCGTWREGAVAWSGQRSVGPSIGSFGVERVRECLSPESALAASAGDRHFRYSRSGQRTELNATL